MINFALVRGRWQVCFPQEPLSLSPLLLLMLLLLRRRRRESWNGGGRRMGYRVQW